MRVPKQEPIRLSGPPSMPAPPPPPPSVHAGCTAAVELLAESLRKRVAERDEARASHEALKFQVCTLSGSMDRIRYAAGVDSDAEIEDLIEWVGDLRRERDEARAQVVSEGQRLEAGLEEFVRLRNDAVRHVARLVIAATGSWDPVSSHGEQVEAAIAEIERLKGRGDAHDLEASGRSSGGDQ